MIQMIVVGLTVLIIAITLMNLTGISQQIKQMGASAEGASTILNILFVVVLLGLYVLVLSTNPLK